ncbi:isoamylase early set domain-containing protein [Gynuella sunshinyii]|uniref:1,4-alpha-glucan branching enzyme n=1 Tax=Gynuella sunshinyii YC6258 TaxID=1445510 RepID=A0A0C5VNY7_9GAMM|nr:isoamylase early set domain-containing protein [Gynuella sunshinyii]AJQ96382.1 1,4-alpha-glucan branching enzyme [Gynuella sunshinyii YC6258]
MSIKKHYVKSTGKTKCTFRLPKQAAPNASEVYIVGDFNEWDPKATPMTKLKTGEFKVELELESGQDYQFRYCIDGEQWENDWEADNYVPAKSLPVENSVVAV